MSNLSPAAQAVVEAIAQPLLNPHGTVPLPAMAAAVLRAAVDQVLPNEKPSGFSFSTQRRQSRRDFLAIAAELENAS